jgi:hypothetical protein
MVNPRRFLRESVSIRHLAHLRRSHSSLMEGPGMGTYGPSSFVNRPGISANLCHHGMVPTPPNKSVRSQYVAGWCASRKPSLKLTFNRLVNISNSCMGWHGCQPIHQRIRHRGKRSSTSFVTKFKRWRQHLAQDARCGADSVRSTNCRMVGKQSNTKPNLCCITGIARL